ncbi:MAG: replication initiation protein, partial [Candidatus Brocadiales bacterium]|nr:replication initiation protein [Candidatus Brocadiales bacterium]
LIPFLLQIRGEKKNFTIYKLGDVLCLPTFYAQRLFIILKSHLNLKKVRASVPDWKSMFGLSEDQYKLYGHFKSRVVLPAINNVKDSTYIERINVVEEKRGRKVEFITLEFESYIGNQQLQLNQENSEKQESKRDDSTKELIRSLTIHDIKPEIVLEAVKKHGLEGTLECRDYALKMIEQKRTTDKPVVNIGGYIARCFKNGWGIESKEKKAAKAEIERKKEVVRQQENNKQLLDKIKKDVDNNRKTKLKTLINSLTDDQNIKMKHEFENEVLTGIHPEILQEFNVSGWSGISVKIIYKNVFLPRKLLQTVDDDYREYSRKLGYNYDELSIHG